MPHPEEVKKHGYVKQKSFNLMKKLSSIDDEVKWNQLTPFFLPRIDPIGNFEPIM